MTSLQRVVIGLACCGIAGAVACSGSSGGNPNGPTPTGPTTLTESERADVAGRIVSTALDALNEAAVTSCTTTRVTYNGGATLVDITCTAASDGTLTVRETIQNTQSFWDTLACTQNDPLCPPGLQVQFQSGGRIDVSGQVRQSTQATALPQWSGSLQLNGSFGIAKGSNATPTTITAALAATLTGYPAPNAARTSGDFGGPLAVTLPPVFPMSTSTTPTAPPPGPPFIHVAGTLYQSCLFFSTGPQQYINPIGGAVVSTTLDSRTATTSAAGRFYLETSVSASAATSVPYTITIRRDGATVYTQATQGSADLLISLTPCARGGV